MEDVNMVWQEHNFRIEMSKIYFEEMAENSSIVSIEEDEQYLTALYLLMRQSFIITFVKMKNRSWWQVLYT